MTNRRPIRIARTAFQAGVVAAALSTGYRYAHGLSRTSIETFCPFGGLESALSLITSRRFTCATGERNLALFIGLVVLTLLARRAFCGWVCPVGAISEWIVRLTALLRGTRTSFASPLPCRVDGVLRWARLVVLGAILWFTYRAGELVFRGFDPYYVMFSFHGHEVKPWSYAVVGGVVLAMAAVPMFWCRHLCPLGAALLPFSAVGWIRIARKAPACTGCGVCDRVCPHAIPIAHADRIRSPECTLCLECSEACPTGALELRGESRP